MLFVIGFLSASCDLLVMDWNFLSPDFCLQISLGIWKNYGSG